MKPLTPEEKLKQLALSVLNADVLVRKAQLEWAARQILHLASEDNLAPLRLVAQRAGISDADIEKAFAGAGVRGNG